MPKSAFPVPAAVLAAFFLLPAAALAMPLPGLELRPARPRELRASLPPEASRPEVRRWVQAFTTGDLRDRFVEFMDRGSYYKTLIQDLLVREGAPPDLYYLAMIESGLVFHARSWADARGMWQFMKPTALRYGLRADQWADERLDVIRSTRAAARYLKDLHRRFGSWPLAMAAYNAGEGRVVRAIRAGGTRDFWRLARKGLLPRETSEYVPKFHAAMLIARDPEYYGFAPLRLYEFPRIRRQRVWGSVLLRDLAQATGNSIEMIRALNPHLLQERVPPSRRGYTVWVLGPQETVARQDEAESAPIRGRQPASRREGAAPRTPAKPTLNSILSEPG